MSLNAEIRGFASIAAREIHHDNSLSPYVEQEIMRGEVNASQASLHPAKRLPLSLKGRFFDDEDFGAVSVFADIEPAAVELFDVADIEACAASGQYLLDSGDDWPVELPADGVEEVATGDSIFSIRTKGVLNLLAGIQVYYDFNAGDLVPTLIYHRGLVNIAYSLRAKMIKDGYSPQSLGLDAAEGKMARAIVNPDARHLDFFAEAAGIAVAKEIVADYI